MNYILILILLGGGGSGPRPSSSIESVNFTTMKACNVALQAVIREKLPDVGPRFAITGLCVPDYD